jgi:sugar fermentation stimulation protein A
VHKITNSGVYILEIFVKNSFTITLRKKDKFILSKGYYYYFGSAQKNLSSRINRHKRKDKITHWHIDNITVNTNAEIINTFIMEDVGKDYECKLREKVEDYFKLIHPIKGFGNSDCENCISHLLFSENRIKIEEITIDIKKYPIEKLGI